MSLNLLREEEVDKWETDQIETALHNARADMINLRQQIAQMVDGSGRSSDPRWHKEAKIRIRINGQNQQTMQRVLGMRRREQRALQADDFSQRFVEAARRRLPDREFQAIRDEAMGNE